MSRGLSATAELVVTILGEMTDADHRMNPLRERSGKHPDQYPD